MKALSTILTLSSAGSVIGTVAAGIDLALKIKAALDRTTDVDVDIRIIEGEIIKTADETLDLIDKWKRENGIV